MKLRFIVDRSRGSIAQRLCERGHRWIRTNRAHALASLASGAATEEVPSTTVARPSCAALAERLRSSVARLRADGDREAFLERQRAHWAMALVYGVDDVVRTLLSAHPKVDTRTWAEALEGSDTIPARVAAAIYHVAATDVWYVPYPEGYARHEFSSEGAAREFLRQNGIDPERVEIREAKP